MGIVNTFIYRHSCDSIEAETNNPKKNPDGNFLSLLAEACFGALSKNQEKNTEND
jgi:hypothetical protein